jgi:hypothetical protein
MNQSQQENIVLVAYSTLGESADSWGHNLVTRIDGTQEYTSTYTDLDLINRHFTKNLINYLPQDTANEFLRFADLGGADGFLARSIIDQLFKINLNCEGLVVDKELISGKTKQAFDEYTLQNPKASDKLVAIAGDFTNPTEINIKQGSLAFATLRNVLQYCGKDKSQMLIPVSHYLAQNAILITQTPICNKENQTNINNFWAEHVQIMQGLEVETSLNSHYFPTLEEIEMYGTQAGFEVLESYLATDMPFKVSVENITNGSRFKIPTEAQKAEIQALFQKHFQRNHYFHIPGVIVFRKGWK